jgi:hypothetical protein
MRRLLAILFGGALLLSIAAPVGAKEFGTIYIDGDTYRTFGNPASVPAGTGTDPIVAFTNFDQGGVAQYAPGAGSHGGRWAVSMATWAETAEPRLLTDYDDVLAEEAAGNLTLVRAPEADFRCPVIPDRGSGG